MNNDLHVFVRDALARGVSREDLKRALRDARWGEDEIEAELSAWHDAGLGLPVPRRRVGSTPREAFLYLLMFVALYIVCYHTGAVWFELIGRTWPDAVALSQPRNGNVDLTVLRFAVASLLVAYPVYLLTSRLTGRAIERDPDKRNSDVRRKLTYLTLFFAACVLIGDFIYVVLNFLSGELTIRFSMKCLVVALIAGWLFLHYLGGLRRDEDDLPAVRRVSSPWFARAGSLFVLAALVVGMWLSGAPVDARRDALDQVRVRGLENVSGQIKSYHADYGRLPEDLALVAAAYPIDSQQMVDPVTKIMYRYAVLDSTSYQLCATFDRADTSAVGSPGSPSFWRHPAGEACFQFRVPPRKH